MGESLPTVYFARHGETAWSLTGQHSGLSDLPLIERGQRTAQQLAEVSRGWLSQRCSQALCSAHATLANWLASERLLELIPTWSNGITVNMRGAAPVTSVWSAPLGSCFATVAPEASRHSRLRRADRALSRVRSINADVLLFSSGHFIRVLASRWLGLELSDNARYFMLSTASLSVLGYSFTAGHSAVERQTSCGSVDQERAVQKPKLIAPEKRILR